MRLIVAADPNGGIGYQNRLPWTSIQGDLPRFKKLTDGQVIVMGRNTWESLPRKPLPGRLNFVVSKSMNTWMPMGSFVIKDVYELGTFKNVWMIGGASLINSAWALLEEIHLTRTFTEYTCDTHIDLIRLSNEFVCISTETHTDHTYEVWRRR